MIFWKEKGLGLIDVLSDAGYAKNSIDGVVTMTDKSGNGSTAIDIAAQSIIDSYDPLPLAKLQALELVKDASKIKRLMFVTQAAGKDAEYIFKAQEAEDFSANGTIGVYLQTRATMTGESVSAIAAEWSAKSLAWKAIGAKIAALEDKSAEEINTQTNWLQCPIVAKKYTDLFESM